MSDAAGPVVVLFGGGGFLGRSLAQELFARGCRVRIAQRAPRAAYMVRPLGGLGYSQFAVCDITDAEQVARVLEGADAAVNLVGILKGDMQAVHVTGARNVAQAAASAGLRALVHVSALGADPESDSNYGRTKGEGEAAVRAAFPGATIVRPSLLFGQDDGLTNRFAGMIASTGIVPVIRGATKFQPAHVGDVARAIALAVTDAKVHGGQTYELGGPDVMTMSELLRWIAEQIGREPSFMPLPDPIAKLLATLTGWAPGAPITLDQYKMLLKDNVPSPGALGFADFGIRPAPMAALAPAWLIRYRKHGRFAKTASA
ncbi:MAG: complex I NDUFA9 subunit family protein [Sphingobium sp.]|nr:complex I NDUFA9 subunit family protein [Sphingobium sp.]